MSWQCLGCRNSPIAGDSVWVGGGAQVEGEACTRDGQGGDWVGGDVNLHCVGLRWRSRSCALVCRRPALACINSAQPAACGTRGVLYVYKLILG